MCYVRVSGRALKYEPLVMVGRVTGNSMDLAGLASWLLVTRMNRRPGNEADCEVVQLTACEGCLVTPLHVDD